MFYKGLVVEYAGSKNCPMRYSICLFYLFVEGFKPVFRLPMTLVFQIAYVKNSSISTCLRL